jgi:hypothetical protein
MRFDECKEGDYRIFVGALDAPRGDGYIAAVVVNKVRADAPPAQAVAAKGREVQREVFRDDSLACGYRWRSPDEALSYAMQRARELVKTRTHQLALA